MAEYGKLLSRIWSDKHFTSLDAHPQQVYCLLISFSTRNLAGVLPLTLKRWAKATADATADTLTDALCVLSERNFVAVDWDTEEVLIRTYIRNDEVYKQPNLMTAARKFALQIESHGLRWVLHDELLRLPGHKEAEKTEQVANLLVDGLERTLPEPFRKPFAEPIAEPIAEGPGVGVSYVGKGNTCTYNEHQPPTPAPRPGLNLVDDEPEPPRAASRKTGAEIARSKFSLIQASGSQLAGEIVRTYGEYLGTPVDAKTSREMATVIDSCLQAGQTPDEIAAGIQMWSGSDSFAPSQIPKYVMKAAATRRHNGVGKPTQQAVVTQNLAAEIIAEMDQP